MAGDIVKITWTLDIVHLEHEIEFSSDGGKTWTSVVKNLPNGTAGKLQSYDWVVPETPTAEGRIRVYQREDKGGKPVPKKTDTDPWNLVSKNFTVALRSTSIAAHTLRPSFKGMANREKKFAAPSLLLGRQITVLERTP